MLATNVAETSLTVPGIRYVIDPGTARISRYSHRTKVQRLPIEPISQASARQRSGRCGRTSDGIAIRLYTEADYLGRPEYTDPEILRTNLASVLLQMASLDLGDVADFPFIDPPDRRAVADGLAVLEELGALDEHGKLTDDRPRAGRPAAGPADGADGGRGRPPRRARGGAGHRRGAHHPGPPRAADRAPAGRRPAARPVRRRELRLPRAAQPLALPRGAAGGAERQPVPPHGQAGVPALPADPRVAGPARPAARHRPPARHDARRARRRGRREGHHRQPAGRPALARRPAGGARRRMAGKPPGQRRGAGSTSASATPAS